MTVAYVFLFSWMRKLDEERSGSICFAFRLGDSHCFFKTRLCLGSVVDTDSSWAGLRDFPSGGSLSAVPANGP